MSKFAVIGLGQFGLEVVSSLAAQRAFVVAIDQDPAVIERVKRFETVTPILMDATDPEALKSAGLQDAEVVLVATASHVETSVLVTALLRELNVPAIHARSKSPLHTRILKKIGAGKVYNPEQEAAGRLARELIAGAHRPETRLPTGHELAEVVAPESFHGRGLADLRLRQTGIQIMAVKRGVPSTNDLGESVYADDVIATPLDDTVIKPGDVLYALGLPVQLERFLERART
jgi:trk system potassium uptake protein